VPTDSKAAHLPDTDLPSISVIIPVFNEERHLQETLKQIIEQDYPADKVEILVVDGGSTDASLEQLAPFLNQSGLAIRLFHNTRKLSSISRNIGVREARNDYILFIDAHVFIPTRKLFRNLGEAVVVEKPLVLGRPQPLCSPRLSVFQEAVSAVRASCLGHSRSSYIYSDFQGWVSPLSVGVMYCRSLFERFGHFDESFDAAEDLEFNARLESQGLKALTSPQFSVFYHPRKTALQLFYQMYRYGLGRVRFLHKHPHRSRREALVPYVVPLGVLLMALLCWAFASLRLPVILFALVSSLFIMLASKLHLPRVRWQAVSLLPLCFLVIHFGLSSGVTKGLLSRTSRTSQASRTKTPNPDAQSSRGP